MWVRQDIQATAEAGFRAHTIFTSFISVSLMRTGVLSYPACDLPFGPGTLPGLCPGSPLPVDLIGEHCARHRNIQ